MILALLERFWKPLAGAAIVILIALFIRGYGDHRYEAGRQDLIAVDAAATKKLRARVAELEAANRETAAAAHSTYEVEHVANVLAARQPLTARQLCLAQDDSRSRMPAPGTAQPGDAASPAASAVVQPVPAADHGLAVDRRRLLGALAGLADEQPAVIREYQAREASGEPSLRP